MMEYGYEITDTAGNKRFFVEGCTYCSMSTGGIHEAHCPCNPNRIPQTLNIERGDYSRVQIPSHSTNKR